MPRQPLSHILLYESHPDSWVPYHGQQLGGDGKQRESHLRADAHVPLAVPAAAGIVLAIPSVVGKGAFAEIVFAQAVVDGAFLSLNRSQGWRGLCSHITLHFRYLGGSLTGKRLRSSFVRIGLEST